MSQIEFNKQWYTIPTSCNVCLLYYTKKKPPQLHSWQALQQHLDGREHGTAVNQLMQKHGKKPDKVKAAALSVKVPKGVKVNLPVSGNYWKYALKQQSNQLSAPSTSTSTTTASSSPSSTTSAITTISNKPQKRQRSSDDTVQRLSQPPDSTVMYTLLKQQQQIDTMQQRMNHMQDTIDAFDAFVAQHAISQSSNTQTQPAAGLQPPSNDNDFDCHSGADDYIEDDTSAADHSNTLPTKAASAPAAPSNNKRQRTSERNAASPSINTRAHPRR
jgi:hypothetical protein